ncbi:MAG: DUF262 domain-containing protein [Cyanobacteria bacterium P01_A01_bin.80]
MTESTNVKEDIDIENNKSELEADNIEPFDSTKIRVDTRPITIDLVLKRIKYDEIDLAPDFQRHANIWTNEAKSRLIESILIRIPLPAFYMYASDDDKWLVIDGIQRLSTLKKFVIDNELILSGLEYLKDLNGKKYSELSRSYQRRIEETVLTIYLIEKGTPPEVQFNAFRRINTGGLSLSNQELRHALTQGKMKFFLDKLASCEEFKKTTKISKKRIDRMEDHEFILGFIGFTLTHYTDYPSKKGRDFFLYETMQKLCCISDEDKNNIHEQFKGAMKAAIDIFDKNSFRKPGLTSNNQKYPVNKALFECWSVTLSKLSPQQIDILKQKKELLNQVFIEYIEEDYEFEKSISQAANKVKYRFKVIKEIVDKVLS